jgi:hypothetical protein
MAMHFEPGKHYRMPVGFGPSVSPRAVPEGKTRDMGSARITVAGARFLTDISRLDALLPPGFAVEGEPVVTVEFHYLTRLEWLAGRGYNFVAVFFPTRFRGQRDEAVGPFAAVLWENRADCCITGREEVGVSKIFAEIYAPSILGGAQHYLATTDGHPFLNLTLTNIEETAPPPPPSQMDGILHYYYVPKFGRPGEAEVQHAVLTPPLAGAQRVVRYQSARGTISFKGATFEQAPTQFMVINALADLPVVESRGCYLIELEGGRDLADQVALF